MTRLKTRVLGIWEKDMNVSAFVKVEKMEKGKDPRLIQSKSTAYKALLGPYIAAFEDEVYKVPNFTKGLNYDD